MQGIGASTSLARLMRVGLSANILLMARLPLRDRAFQVDCKLSCLSTLMMCTCFCQGRNTIQVRWEAIYSEPNSCLGEKYRSLGGPQGPALVSAFGPTTADVRGNRPIELAARGYFSAVFAGVLLIWYWSANRLFGPFIKEPRDGL